MRARWPRQLFGLIKIGHNDLRFGTGLNAHGVNDLLCPESNPVSLWKTEKTGFPQGSQEQLLLQYYLLANIQGVKILLQVIGGEFPLNFYKTLFEEQKDG